MILRKRTLLLAALLGELRLHVGLKPVAHRHPGQMCGVAELRASAVVGSGVWWERSAGWGIGAWERGGGAGWGGQFKRDKWAEREGGRGAGHRHAQQDVVMMCVGALTMARCAQGRIRTRECIDVRARARWARRPAAPDKTEGREEAGR